MIEYKGYLIPQTKEEVMQAGIPGTMLPGIIVRDASDPAHYLTLAYSAHEIFDSKFDMDKAVKECMDMINELLEWTAKVESFMEDE